MSELLEVLHHCRTLVSFISQNDVCHQLQFINREFKAFVDEVYWPIIIGSNKTCVFTAHAFRLHQSSCTSCHLPHVVYLLHKPKPNHGFHPYEDLSSKIKETGTTFKTIHVVGTRTSFRQNKNFYTLRPGLVILKNRLYVSEYIANHIRFTKLSQKFEVNWELANKICKVLAKSSEDSELLLDSRMRRLTFKILNHVSCYFAEEVFKSEEIERTFYLHLIQSCLQLALVFVGKLDISNPAILREYGWIFNLISNDDESRNSSTKFSHEFEKRATVTN